MVGGNTFNTANVLDYVESIDTSGPPLTLMMRNMFYLIGRQQVEPDPEAFTGKSTEAASQAALRFATRLFEKLPEGSTLVVGRVELHAGGLPVKTTFPTDLAAAGFVQVAPNDPALEFVWKKPHRQSLRQNLEQRGLPALSTIPADAVSPA